MNTKSIWEKLIVIAVFITFIAGVTMILNPSAQLARIRNTQRRADINILANRVGEKFIADQGDWRCSSGEIPLTASAIGNVAPDHYDMSKCLVPEYFPIMPVDPKKGFVEYKIESPSYYSDYTLVRHENGKITISAPSAELGEIISISR